MPVLLSEREPRPRVPRRLRLGVRRALPPVDLQLMGRSHDFHCSACHSWVSGFDLAFDDRCPCGGELDYDLNREGCDGCKTPGGSVVLRP